MSDKRMCFRCGNRYTECHHVFGGTANRRLADKDGCFVWLCRTCHVKFHEPKTPADYEFRQFIREEMQKLWQRKFKGTKEDFIKRYGKSYL